MYTRTQLIRKLRCPDNKLVLQAVEELRVRGWLSDGTLRGVALCHAQLQGADLMSADLRGVDFHQAHLEWADLSMADLSGAKLSRAHLCGANLDHARLSEADLFKANLKKARNLRDTQLVRARRLWGAIMPDGETYDGRYNLPGDLEFARQSGVEVEDAQAMADFHRVSLETYLHGQELAEKALFPEAINKAA
ncbi:MAG: hypothetical protein Kow0063_33300 [Anaerolineae bacterium]